MDLFHRRLIYYLIILAIALCSCNSASSSEDSCKETINLNQESTRLKLSEIFGKLHFYKRGDVYYVEKCCEIGDISYVIDPNKPKLDTAKRSLSFNFENYGRRDSLRLIKCLSLEEIQAGLDSLNRFGLSEVGYSLWSKDSHMIVFWSCDNSWRAIKIEDESAKLEYSKILEGYTQIDSLWYYRRYNRD